MEAEFLSTKECLSKIRQHGSTAQEMIESLFKANVFEVLEVIQSSECICVNDIQSEMDNVSQPNTSFALMQLRFAGLVERKRVGKYKFYHIVPGSIERLNRICSELADGYDASVTAMDLVEAV